MSQISPTAKVWLGEKNCNSQNALHSKPLKIMPDAHQPASKMLVFSGVRSLCFTVFTARFSSFCARWRHPEAVPCMCTPVVLTCPGGAAINLTNEPCYLTIAANCSVHYRPNVVGSPKLMLFSNSSRSISPQPQYSPSLIPHDNSFWRWMPQTLE